MPSGQGNISYNQPPGAGGGGGGGTGTVTGANNALTSNGVLVQFGQVIGAVGNPGQLIHDTEVPMNNHLLEMLPAIWLPGGNFQFAIAGPQVDTGDPVQFWMRRADIMTSIDEIYHFVQPVNYNPAGPQRFVQWVEDADVNEPDPRHNVVGCFWGYNSRPGGAPELPGEAQFAFKSETYFGADGTKLFEFHLPEMVDDAGGDHRLWSIYNHRPDGFSYIQSKVNSIALRPNDPLDNNDYFNVARDNATGNTQLFLAPLAGSSGISRIRMQDNTGFLFTDISKDVNSLNVGSGGSGDFLLGMARAFMPGYVVFNESNFFGDGNTYLQSFGGDATHGFHFLASDGTALCNILGGGVGNPVTLQTGNIFCNNLQTTSPGLGSGIWELGQVQAGVVVMDAANYVEISIGGVVVKLLKAA
jgi:hypothetical protein